MKLALAQGARLISGPINGAIHAAELGNGNDLREDSRCRESVWRPKIQGTTVLESVLADTRLISSSCFVRCGA